MVEAAVSLERTSGEKGEALRILPPSVQRAIALEAPLRSVRPSCDFFALLSKRQLFSARPPLPRCRKKGLVSTQSRPAAASLQEARRLMHASYAEKERLDEEAEATRQPRRPFFEAVERAALQVADSEGGAIRLLASVAEALREDRLLTLLGGGNENDKNNKNENDKDNTGDSRPAESLLSADETPSPQGEACWQGVEDLRRFARRVRFSRRACAETTEEVSPFLGRRAPSCN